MEQDVQERLEGLGQLAAGAGLLTLQFWAPILDNLVRGAHAVASLSGAILGIAGLVKLARGKRRGRGN